MKLQRERERVSEEDKYDMAGLVAGTAQMVGELEDIESGTRDTKEHPHHKPKHLRIGIRAGINNIFRLGQEINRNK